jgi:hypothetical protein
MRVASEWQAGRNGNKHSKCRNRKADMARYIAGT